MASDFSPNHALALLADPDLSASDCYQLTLQAVNEVFALSAQLKGAQDFAETLTRERDHAINVELPAAVEEARAAARREALEEACRAVCSACAGNERSALTTVRWYPCEGVGAHLVHPCPDDPECKTGRHWDVCIASAVRALQPSPETRTMPAREEAVFTATEAAAVGYACPGCDEAFKEGDIGEGDNDGYIWHPACLYPNRHAPPVSTWIKVSERLPAPGEPVAILVQIYDKVRLAGFHDGKVWRREDGSVIRDGMEAIAWSPLPPVPKEAEPHYCDSDGMGCRECVPVKDAP